MGPNATICARCGHSSDWHRMESGQDPTLPETPFRCLGYNATQQGPPDRGDCTCPDFVAALEEEE
jgi:hypothetical protein